VFVVVLLAASFLVATVACVIQFKLPLVLVPIGVLVMLGLALSRGHRAAAVLAMVLNVAAALLAAGRLIAGAERTVRRITTGCSRPEPGRCQPQENDHEARDRHRRHLLQSGRPQEPWRLVSRPPRLGCER